jgi:hypothetical protein
MYTEHELFEQVRQVSRYVAGAVEGVDADDLAQYLWIERFEIRKGRVWASQYSKPELFKFLLYWARVVAKEMIRKEHRQVYEQHYSVDRVKAILWGKQLDEASTEDLAEAMEWLRVQHPSQAEAVAAKHGVKRKLTSTERVNLMRAYESLADEMNRLWFEGSRELDFFEDEGPGLTEEQMKLIFAAGV